MTSSHSSLNLSLLSSRTVDTSDESDEAKFKEPRQTQGIAQELSENP